MRDEEQQTHVAWMREAREPVNTGGVPLWCDAKADYKFNPSR
jgi:hypothetical protein